MSNLKNEQYIQSIENNLPQDLKSIPAFTNVATNNSKLPVSPHTLKPFKVYESDVASFETALKNVADSKSDAIGIRADQSNSVVVFDFDHVLNSQGEFTSQKSKDFFQQLPNTYVELSLSGTGLHAICFMNPDEKKIFEKSYGTKKIKISFDDDGSDIEIFVNTQSTRLTGNLFSNQTHAIASLSFDMLDALISTYKPKKLNTTQFSKNQRYIGLDITNERLAKKLIEDPKFTACWNGDASYFNGDESRADMSLIQNLCFVCEGNYNEIDSLFRQSPAFQSVLERKKNHAEDYIRRTIETAVNSYSPNYFTTKESDSTMLSDSLIPIDYNGTDFANAEWFVDIFKDSIRFNLDSKKFMLWNRDKWIWQEVETYSIKSNVNELAKRLLHAAKNCNDDTQAKFFTKKSLYLQSERGISACIKLVQNQKRIHVTNDLFNRDPWILPCLNGYLDLHKVSKLDDSYFITDESSCREMYFTKSVNIPFNPEIYSEIVADTFEFPFSQDERGLNRYDDQREFLKLLGCCLIGENLNNKFVICYGNGANGKSVILNSVMETLGDFATVADASQFVESNSRFESRKAADPGLAELEGMRFVLSTDDFKAGQKLSGGKIKIHTSQELIVARKLHENDRKFKPTWTVFTMWNNFPEISENENNALRRRLSAIEFGKSLPENLQDKFLLSKLTTIESKQAILNLLLLSLRLYFFEGLKETESMKSMRVEILEQDNTLKEFIEKNYDFDSYSFISLKEFISSYNDEFPHKKKKDRQIRDDLNNMVWELLPDRKIDCYQPYKTRPWQIRGLKLKSDKK